MPRPRHSAGFTIIELMVTVIVVGIFAAVAVPSFSNMVNNNRLRSASSELYSLIQFARSTAAQNSATYNVCLSSGEWTVKKLCSDTNALRSFTAPSTVDIASSVASFSFYSNGTASASASIISCIQNKPADGYKLEVLTSGFVRQSTKGKDGSGTLGSCTP